MRAFVLIVPVALLSAAPLFAQTTISDRGFITASGGFTTNTEATSGNIDIQGGLTVAPHLQVYGNIGQYMNLQPSDSQSAVDATTGLVAASMGLNVTGEPRVPALYVLGGLRYETPKIGRVEPYVMGGLGVAHLSPTATFTFNSGTGTLPDGSTPTAGQDVTAQLMTGGDFTNPAASNAFMYSLGGGIQIPIVASWAVDVGYRFSRIDTDTPINTQGMTFGFGYRF
jgi:opacity protein-like surface antigen